MIEKPSVPLKARLRPDLVAVPIETPRGQRWHLKDPITLQFFQFDAREFALLQMLDGRATLDELVRRYQRAFAPQVLTERQLLFFIDEARRNGLLLLERHSTNTIPTQTAPEEQNKSPLAWLRSVNPLAIRLPGINPDGWLEVLYPFVRWVFTPAATITGLGLILGAVLLVLLRFDEFLARLPSHTSFFTPQTILWLAGAMVVTKVLHELAHAFACKHFGGECHELGIMLLVFVPCLYCNVSDSWLLARRRERMLITAAGMWTELLLAAAATFVWWFAVDGPVRMGALAIAFVGSVSTVLLNGNPLLRYDGYYLFSDLIQVPNLSAESSRVLSRWWYRYGLGLREVVPPRIEQSTMLLAAYGLASFLYRIVILAAILLAVHALGREFRLQFAAWILTFIAIASLVSPPLTAIARPLLRRQERRRIQPAHATTAFVLIAATIGSLLLIPVPLSVRAPLVIEADGAERVFVSVPGRLVETLPEGRRVQAGELVGRLENLDLQYQRESLTARQELLERQLRSYQATRGESDASSVRIPATRTALDEVGRQLATLDTQLARLELRAGRHGTILAPPNIPQQPTAREELPVWSGSPLDPANHGCYLEPGTPLCLIGDPQSVNATVIVSQNDLKLIRRDQPVDLQLSGLSDRTLTGRVREISPVPIDTLPRELVAQAAIPVDSKSKAGPKPLEPMYRVRVQLPEEVRTLAPTRWSTGEARIRLASEPLIYRIWRGLQRTFHFEL